MKKRTTILCMMLLLVATVAQAQISIRGNVYGGGNEGDLGGGTKVVVRAGDIYGSVYGGARQANVGGATFVNIDGEHMSGDILINYVYGGNDIAGTIGMSAALPTTEVTTTNPQTQVETTTTVPLLIRAAEYGIDNTYNTFVLSTQERTLPSGEQPYKIYIGQFFAGGNGDYTYTNKTVDTNGKERYDVTVGGQTMEAVIKPELDKAYIEMRGGTCAVLYGGGNNVTIKEKTDICIDNASAISTDIFERDANGDETTTSKITDDRLKAMGIFQLGGAGENIAESSTYQFARVFGGNNKAPMNIRPKWHLERGKIRNLYSGGNRGAMTYEKGIFLPIFSSNMEVNNVYGGCRMADVNPGKDIEQEEIEGVLCPPGYAARVHIGGGNINNVYGGNDVSGTVYYGTAVGIHSSVNGDVYGGGNGSYPYTDNPELANTALFGDFYYDVNTILGQDENTVFTGAQSAEALYKFRPNTEAVTVRLIGDHGANNPTIIGGSVYCGGNSTTLHPARSAVSEATSQLKVGAHVYADKVFLGNNGENMVKEKLLQNMSETVNPETGVFAASGGKDFSRINLLDAGQFASYMEGCEMDIKPEVVFDLDYEKYTTYFGSLFCGGNIGSIDVDGEYTINFNKEVIIYDKLVGGSNNAYVPAGTYNAAYDGGLLGEPASADEGKIGNKLTLNLSGLKIQPKRWKNESDKTQGLEWNVYTNLGVKTTTPTTLPSNGESTTLDLNRRLMGGNIYGGCYNSGHVNGNVVININATLVDTDILFDKVELDDDGEELLLDGDDLHPENKKYHILERRSGVILNQQGVDVLGKALNVFGGGKGKDTEIWGSTTINLNKNSYVFQIFGGSEEGVIGKSTGTSTAANGDWSAGVYSFNGKSYQYNPNYSCTVNLKGEKAGVPMSVIAHGSSQMADCEYIYGGGYIGPTCGNTFLNLGNGRIYQSFSGACNADILGHTETIIGQQINDDGTVNAVDGFPYIRDCVYGANDLGGRILNTADFTSRIRNEIPGLTLPGRDAAKEVSAYIEYRQGYAVGIYGGCYGTYDYTDPEYSAYFDNEGNAKAGYTKPRMDNAFVNFRPNVSDQLKNNPNNTMSEIYGAGEGAAGDPERDIMQNRSYILIDIPQDMENFKQMEVFGAGAWSGLGMREYVAPVATPNATQKAALDKMSAIIDLPRGQINAVYGGSYQEGFTRRTVVSVPEKSTIKLNKLFGGAYGLSNDTICDVYEGNVTWSSANAQVSYIFGGNNNARRTLYGRVNINAPVWTDKTSGYMASVYGAGCGENTWSQYTEVNLNKGTQLYMVYGGGQNGRVCNVATAKRISIDEYNDTEYKGMQIDVAGNYAEDGLNNPLAKPRHDGKTYNTNVIINKGAIVGSYTAGYPPGFVVGGGYAYGGGQGAADKNRSGDVNGSTYIALLGGTVEKDLVAAGSVGSVFDRYGTLTDDFGNHFVASTTAYVAAGSVRNVYGGGYMGSVGKHKTTEQLKDKDNNLVFDENDNPVMIEVDAPISASTSGDIPAQANVIIGIRQDQSTENLQAQMDYVKGESAENGATYGFYNGVPVVQRNVYGGGEGETKKGGRGGAVYGTANVIMNNGRIGYDYLNGQYVEKLNDETWMESDSIGRLKDYGNIFGGGYSDKSNVDSTRVVIWGGMVRGSVHGGAEVAAIGRGSTKESGEANSVREFEKIYLPGKTSVVMYDGHVLRNVFGGGKGYNVLGFGGANDLYTDGYVFGQTEVYIHGGEVGTAESVKAGKNNGNVFGGGDLGYVYSKGYDNPKTVADKAAGKETGSPGHYYYYYNRYKCTSAYDNYHKDDVVEACIYDMMTASEKSHWTADGDASLTEDCKVVIAPYLQVKSASATINGKTKAKYDYFETDDLNTLSKNKEDWDDLFTGDKRSADDMEERGVLIHNAVFGGGNVSSNSDTHYANATTVFANTTATLYDCYHRDFITIGTEHIGGLYGGGNLSKSDGYRELNVTSYGTDYYGLSSRITLDEYKNLSNRERAYFQLEYVCKNGTETKVVNNETKYGVYVGEDFYENGQRVKEEDFEKLKLVTGFNADNWEQFGFCSIYAGRLLNTIQRAELCGVFGSRMVLQGAKDRIAEIGEDIDYTINRVGELSLNKQASVMAADTGTDEEIHGNYFGIYSIVNYLGNLTSDVKFGDPYVDSDGNEVAGKTYYSYKKEQPTGNGRNYGTSPNQVALASGVFLELTTEKTERNPNKEKEYGYITGVIELDLINVKRATEGGGFVYAKNEHRVPRFYPNMKNVLLSEYNQPRYKKDANGDYVLVEGQKVEIRDDARSYKQYRYSADQEGDWSSEGSYIISGDIEANQYQYQLIETSGNFIHPQKRIVDDCYPTNNAYIPTNDPYSPSHYWYVKGSVYVYDQVVSAYTGSPNAYSKHVHLPLTITAASNGRLELINVKPNLYAYYFEEGKKIGTEGNDGKAWVNNNTDMYQLNDVITWWEWNHLSVADKKLFVKETVVNCKPCKIDGTEYDIGEYVMLPTDIDGFKAADHTITDTEGHVLTDEKGDPFDSTSALVDDLFRLSNNVGNETGYVLTVDMDTPKVWDNYFTKESDKSDKITQEAYDLLSENDQNEYVQGPTFYPTASGIYGQRDYSEGDIVTKAVYDKIPSTEQVPTSGKNYMEVAYVATDEVSYTYKGQNKTLNKGTAIPESEYDGLTAEKKAFFGKAWVCIDALKLSENAYMINGDLLTASEIETLKTNYTDIDPDDIDAAVTEAYICTKTGKYGGQMFDKEKNYSAIESWCALSTDDRENFNYNYDALDLFADPNYLDFYDPSSVKSVEAAYHAPYSDLVKVEYTAIFNSDASKTVRFNDGTTRSFTKGADGSTLTREEFETVRNDKRYYTRVDAAAAQTYAYVAIDNFTDNGTPYGKGQVVDEEVYVSNMAKVKQVEVTGGTTVYYCFEAHDEGNTHVALGATIDESHYKNDLIDDQKYFTIQGQEPTEITTLYVNRESDYRDMTQERVITAIYQYTYYENGDNGDVKLTNELHVVNIHLQLQSGQPIIGQLNDPPIVLPGSSVGLDRPEVIPGIYEVLINGWMLYPNKNDAEHHRNGVPFTNNKTPVYWYQNQDHYVAFYSKTYKGYTYSNPVPLHVANYHDIGDVMERYKDNHLYIDRADVDRPSKIYINDYSSLGADDPRKGKNGLDELKNLYDLSLLTPTEDELDDDGLIKSGTFEGHAPMDSHIAGANNLEFILRTDLDGAVPEGSPERTSIAAGTDETDPCFGGDVHGDGHTISGLTHSLFGKLCGNVYNLGVTGSFTSAGIADAGEGFVENCWVKSSVTELPDGDSKVNAVFGNPSVSGNPNCVQVVNCYYPESNAALYNDESTARKMPDKSFYNGEVTYNLNGFYLGKRYYDGIGLSAGDKYDYLPTNFDGTLPTNTEGTQTITSPAYYPTNYAYYIPQGTKLTPNLGYVEHRFYDGDFRFADGSVPIALNVRRQENPIPGDEENTAVTWVPIWPDDYLFFGQTLTYGYVDGRSHQALPSYIRKSNDRLPTDEKNNRVYRAPAYFRNNEMRVAYFNPAAVFAQTIKNDESKVAQKDMTAIDFTGRNDVTQDYQNQLTTAAPYNHVEGGAFYPPLLDDGGLTSFQNVNLTRNLLVYTQPKNATPQTVGERTANVVSAKLHDYAYEEGNATGDGYVPKKATYHTVAEWDSGSNFDNMQGHWVYKSNDNYSSALDHFLVDEQDFNAPIGYTFAEGKRMWYQRHPKNFVNNNTGWECISLPFTVETVTTDQKGELTHFFGTSNVGHEYWLRRYSDLVAGEPATAAFVAPSSSDGSTVISKNRTNTFLWDYYYEGVTHGHKDGNEDVYKNYYQESHTYDNYPLQMAGVPYLIGFPGKTYYEFDLSGEWTADYTAPTRPAKLDEQVITFASVTGTSIGVSDAELAGVEHNGFWYKPNYLNINAPAGTYVMNDAGSSFDRVPAATTAEVKAFRTYFSNSAAITRSVTFNSDYSKLGNDENESDDDEPEALTIYSKKRKVVVSSSLRSETEVRIFHVNGICVADFTIQPGQTVVTPVGNYGIYIVKTTNGRHEKKLAVQ